MWSKGPFDYRRCPQCGVAWVDPLLTDAAVVEIYDVLFQDKHTRNPESPTFRPYRPLLRHIARFNESGRLLDVGCFTGNFLLAARDAGWHRAQGTEISAQAIKYAREVHGLDVHSGNLDTLDLPRDHYDVVTLLDVIEHVRDPALAVGTAFSLLRPGGLVYLNTPHMWGIPARVLGKRWCVFFPWHRTYFSVAAMREMLRSAGFGPIRVHTMGVLPFRRGDPWAEYLTLSAGRDARRIPADPASRPRPGGSRLARWVRDHRRLLRPCWSLFKATTRSSLASVSHLGVHLGATLIASATKPHRPQGGSRA